MLVKSQAPALLGVTALVCIMGAGVASGDTSPASKAPDPSSQAYTSTGYRTCADVEAAGIGRIYRGSSLYNYNVALDRDDDGIACNDNRSDDLYDVVPGGLAEQTNTTSTDPYPLSAELPSAKGDNKIDQKTGMLKSGSSSSTTRSPSEKDTSSQGISTVPHYKNCADAQAKHSGPIPRSDPRYRRDLDKNHNGIACEANTPVNKPLLAKHVSYGPKVQTDYVP